MDRHSYIDNKEHVECNVYKFRETKKMDLTTEDVCRLCTKYGCNYYSIFDSNDTSVLDKIHNCLPLIMINSNDQLPNRICLQCFEALNISDHLRIQSLLADSLLRKQLELFVSKNIKQEMDNNENDSETLNRNFEEVNIYEEKVDKSQLSESIYDFCEDEFTSPNDLQQNKYKAHYMQSKDGDDIVINKHSDDNNTDNFIDVNAIKDITEIKEEDILPSEHIFIVTDEKEETHGNLIDGNTIENANKIEGDIVHSKDPFIADNGKNDSKCDTSNVMTKEKKKNSKTFNITDKEKKKRHSDIRHKKIEEPKSPEKCKKTKIDVTPVKKPIEKKIRQKYKCKYCAEKFFQKHELLSHYKKNHYDAVMKDPHIEKFICKECNRSYIDKSIYTRHLRRHQAKNDGIYECTYCEKRCISNDKLKDHTERVHKRNKELKCDICPSTFYNENNLKAHKRRQHKLTCTLCYKRFIDWKYLDLHYREKHKMQASKHDKFSCDQCDATFTRNLLLKDHQNMMHTGEKPYSCETCGKKFRTYTGCRTHEQEHKNSGFDCDYCMKKFNFKKTLKKHIPIHQNPRDWLYDCEICRKKFANNARLQYHMKKDLDIHLLKCDLCGMKMLGLHTMRKHKSQKHDIWEKKKSTKV